MWSPITADGLPRVGSFVVVAIDGSGHWHSSVMSWCAEEDAFSVSGHNVFWDAASVARVYGWMAVVPADSRDWTMPSSG